MSVNQAGVRLTPALSVHGLTLAGESDEFIPAPLAKRKTSGAFSSRPPARFYLCLISRALNLLSRTITWNDGVHADGGVASQREAEILLPPVHANDPEEREVGKVRFQFFFLTLK